jgi:hypothetical protein
MTHSERNLDTMNKNSANQNSKYGKVINPVGDNLEITIVQSGKPHKAPKAPKPPKMPGGGETIIAPVGDNPKVFINGKRVK